MPTRKHFTVRTLPDKSGGRRVDLQLLPEELRAIGHVTTQWAFLEFLIRRETLGLARYLRIPPPEDVDAVSFRKRRELWKDLSEKALKQLPEELSRSREAIRKTSELAPERHRLTHDIIEYVPEDRGQIKAFPRSSLGKVGWPLNAMKIERIAQAIALLSFQIMSIHRDPVILPDASPRIPEKRDPSNPMPEHDNPGRRPANSRSRKRRQ
jgi:hypothetical protein